jgi:hypothetical protein
VIVTPFNSGAQSPGGLSVAIFRINPAIAAAPTAPLTIREAVGAFLAGLSGLAAIVGTRIYYADPSQMAAYPCVRVKLTNQKDINNLSGFAGASISTIEIAGLALFESQAVAIGEVVRNNYQGFRGTQSGVAILRCLRGETSEDTTEPPDGSDNWIYEVTIPYVICHRVPAPTSVTQTDV